MKRIRIWVYDGILASGVAGSIDVFTAANMVWVEARAGGQAKSSINTPLLQWQIESPDGRQVETASRQIVHVDGPLNSRGIADAVIVTGPFVANIERFFERDDVIKQLM